MAGPVDDGHEDRARSARTTSSVLSNVTRVCADCLTNPKHGNIAAVILLIVELGLAGLIIRFVPCMSQSVESKS